MEAPQPGSLDAHVGRYWLVVHLWVRPGQEAAFLAFERRASAVMAQYGGRIEQAVRIRTASAMDDPPSEIHLVSFPDAAAFAAYRHDAATKQLAEARAQVIGRTVLFAGVAGENFTG